MIAFCFISLVVLMILGVPITVSLTISAFVSLIVGGNTGMLQVFPARMVAGVNTFPLVAILFFIFAGELMLQGGISARIVSTAKLFLSRVRGSLVIITMVACAFFGALSGSAVATTLAIGSIMYPEMKKDPSYDNGWAVTVQAAGGILGPIIPPSIGLVLYGSLTSTSVGDLFIATVIPGLLICVCMIGCGLIICKIRDYGRIEATTEKKTFIGFLKTLMDSVWALLTPMIILGGIYSGIFSPTEAAAVACVYAFIVGKFVYRELSMKAFWNAAHNTVKSCANIMLLVASAGFYSWMLTINNVPRAIMEVVTSHIHSQAGFLLLANVVLLFLGMFMDFSAIVMLVTPLMAPIALSFGVDMIHFGIITCVNLTIGSITPPFGNTLFASNSLDRDIKLETIYRHSLPFIAATVAGLLVITYVPQVSLFLLGR